MRNSIVVGSVVTVAALIGCTAEPDVTYHRDVKPLLAEKCLRCHHEGGISGIPFETYDQVAPMKDLIVEAVALGIMPPWLAEAGCEEYVDDPSLTAEQKTTLRRWMELDAPEGDASDVPLGASGASGASGALVQGLSRIDLELSMVEPYSPRVDVSDDYRCFLIDWPEATDKFVTGLGVIPGDTTVVHHVLTYVVHPEDVAAARASDDLDAGPGWSCFGGPDEASAGLGGWAPGAPPREYPEGTGIAVPAGSAIILEIHYHSQGVAAADNTSVIVKLEDSVAKQAEIIPITNPLWLDEGGMVIPAGDPEVTFMFSTPVDVFVDRPFVIYDATPHMHRRGVGESLWVQRENGEIDCVLEVPRWDFDWQLTYVLAEPKVVYPGDHLGIGCTFDNSAANQPADDDTGLHDVEWGEGTGDEMCLGFYYVTFE